MPTDGTVKVAELLELLDFIGSYIILFCSLFAVGGFLALLRARWADKSTPHTIRRDLTIVYVGSIVCILFEAVRVVWDSFVIVHFPLAISRVILIVVFPMIGNAAFRLYHSRDKWFPPMTGMTVTYHPTNPARPKHFTRNILWAAIAMVVAVIFTHITFLYTR